MKELRLDVEFELVTPLRYQPNVTIRKVDQEDLAWRFGHNIRTDSTGRVEQITHWIQLVNTKKAQDPNYPSIMREALK